MNSWIWMMVENIKHHEELPKIQTFLLNRCEFYVLSKLCLSNLQEYLPYCIKILSLTSILISWNYFRWSKSCPIEFTHNWFQEFCLWGFFIQMVLENLSTLRLLLTINFWWSKSCPLNSRTMDFWRAVLNFRTVSIRSIQFYSYIFI